MNNYHNIVYGGFFMHQFEEKTLKRNTIFEGKIISVHVDEVLLPNGKTSKREIVEHPGAVAVIALTDDKKLVFVKQYRKPLERTLIEIPAGKIEPNEEPHITALRELEEETGYTSEKLQHITSFYTSPGFADELIHLYFTNDITKLDKPIQGDEDEFLEIIELTLEEAEQYAKEQKIYDAKTAYAVMYAKLLE